jgi:hypothetical protein
MKRDYKVGFKKPPQGSRFRKGESGNPGGRPKGTRNFKTDLSEELGRTVVIREGGKERRVSKQAAFIARQVAGALGGEPRASALVSEWILRLLSEKSGDEPAPLDQDEKAVLQLLEERIRRRLRSASNPPSEAPGTSYETS